MPSGPPGPVPLQIRYNHVELMGWHGSRATCFEISGKSKAALRCVSMIGLVAGVVGCRCCAGDAAVQTMLVPGPSARGAKAMQCQDVHLEGAVLWSSCV